MVGYTTVAGHGGGVTWANTALPLPKEGGGLLTTSAAAAVAAAALTTIN